MDNKYTYYVISCEEGGKRYAFAEKIENGNNLLCYFERLKTAKSVNACATYKEAKRIATFWNDCYKRNNTYLF